MIVIMDVAAAEPNNLVSPKRSLKIIHDNDVALAEAEKPTIGSKTRKPSISCIKVMNTTSGIMYGTITYRTRCHREAPSICAASTVSLGTVCKPA